MNNKFTVKGSGPVLEFLKHRPEAIIEIKGGGKKIDELRESGGFNLSQIKLIADPVLKDLEAFVRIKQIPIEQRYDLWKQQEDTKILMLDSITDPRNLGAIIRSCAFFGIRDVIIRETRQVALTDVVVQTARGGLALCNIVSCKNLAREVRALKEIGFWVMGATPSGEPLKKWRGKFEKAVILMGSEGEGISKNLEGLCDVRIAIEGQEPHVESLNVSVAAGVILHSMQS